MIWLFRKVKRYQTERLTQDAERILECVRLMKDEDLDRLQPVQPLQELNDGYSHFVLYYGNGLPLRQETFRQKEMSSRASSTKCSAPVATRRPTDGR
jgi:transcription elongation factor SPT6